MEVIGELRGRGHAVLGQLSSSKAAFNGRYAMYPETETRNHKNHTKNTWRVQVD